MQSSEERKARAEFAALQKEVAGLKQLNQGLQELVLLLVETHSDRDTFRARIDGVLARAVGHNFTGIRIVFHEAARRAGSSANDPGAPDE